jgi:phosphatidate cytidylyltransferase
LLSCAPQSLWFIPLAVVIAMLVLVGRVGFGAASAARAGAGLGLTLLGAFYVGALFPYFALVRNRSGGISTLILVLLLVMASDTGAYFTGVWLGRTKLAPRVSPKKTVEGAVGGLAACVIAGLVLRAPLGAELSVTQILLISAAIGILAQLGDLAGSALKRSAGVKDSGWIMPGHGGLLDRTCSMVFANMLVYYWIR